jgi:homoserine dehydrogenase
MAAGITPADVELQSLRDVPPARILTARQHHKRLRLVTSVWREGGAGDASPGRVRARLRAEDLDIEHPLAAVGGASLGVLLHTDLMADVLVSERHALVPQTAYGVYADLLHLCRTS